METDTIQDAAKLVCCQAYSRYPVFDHSINNIAGLVISNDIIRALIDGREQEPVSAICESGHAVPADMRSDDLLVYFLDRHVRMAVVQNQQGTVGLVTLNDVLEELVGEVSV